jgi:hypothetical protein
LPAALGAPSTQVPTCTWSLPLPALCTCVGSVPTGGAEPGVSAGSGNKVGQSPSLSWVPAVGVTEFMVVAVRE